jgi:hypothetical protein
MAVDISHLLGTFALYLMTFYVLTSFGFPYLSAVSAKGVVGERERENSEKKEGGRASKALAGTRRVSKQSDNYGATFRSSPSAITGKPTVESYSHMQGALIQKWRTMRPVI